MGVCGKLCTFLVLLIAVVLGLVLSGTLAKITPLMKFIDTFEVDGKPVLLGMAPALHRGTPWGYTFEELQATDLKGKVILVTGGNIGLGYWTAYHLAKQDAQVVIACRNAKKCAAAAEDIKEKTKKTVTPMTCDLGSFQSILAFTKEFNSKYKQLDSLILNAGLGANKFTKTVDGLETTIGVNHFGHFLLTEELLPVVKKTAKSAGVATIVSVSSAAHYSTYPEGILSMKDMINEDRYKDMDAYGQSKLANVLFTQELAERVKKDNILVNVIHPGLVRTQMQEQFVDKIGETIGATGRDLLDKNVFAPVSWTGSDASLTQIYAAVGKKLIKAKTTGKYFHPIAREVEVSDQAQDVSLQRKLWKMSEEFVAKRKKELGA